MAWKIPLFKIYTDKADVAAVTNRISSGMYWAIGDEIGIFEEHLAQYVGTKYAITFNSGTSALHALMLAYGIGPGDEVIVPSLTFIATANTPRFTGARPVFAEVEGETYGLDPKDVERKITKRTKAIIPVHFGGVACKHIGELQRIAKKHKVLLLEDAAESLGATVGKKKVGALGDAAVFSFCGPKVITTGEGGAVTTNSRALYEKLKLLRSHGRLETKNYFATADYMDYVTLGYNFRMSNILAALGIAQLAKIEKIIPLRQTRAAYYDKELSKLKQLEVLKTPKGYRHVYQMYTVRTIGNERDALRKFLNDRSIMAKNYPAVHFAKTFRDTFTTKRGMLPITEDLSDRVLNLPLYPTMTTSDLRYVVKAIKDFYA